MKRFINLASLMFLMALSMLFSRPVDAQPRVGVSINFQTFYDQLSPYGDWIDYPDYGYVWRPRLGADFRPYATNGRWMYTNDDDWMWYSDYEWGWAPFHYGRWFYDPYYGWVWVPGYEWSPAWVAWRGSRDYYGWAPLRPGISINIGFSNYNPPYDYWTFAPCRYMSSRYINRYYHPYRNNVTIINNTTIINNYYGGREGRRGGYYSNGPRRTDVERYTGRIRTVSIRESNRPGRSSFNRNEISVYRPTVQRGSGSTYSPRRVQSYDRSRASASDRDFARNSNRDPRENILNNKGRSDNRSTEVREVRTRANSDARIRDRESAVEMRRQGTVENEQRRIQRDVDHSRAAEMRQRRTEIQQRENVNNDRREETRGYQRSTEVHERNQERQVQRDAEMRQRRQQIESQREQETRQRAMEMRQREEARASENRRASEVRQRQQAEQQRAESAQREPAVRSRPAEVQRSAPTGYGNNGYEGRSSESERSRRSGGRIR